MATVPGRTRGLGSLLHGGPAERRDCQVALLLIERGAVDLTGESLSLTNLARCTFRGRFVFGAESFTLNQGTVAADKQTAVGVGSRSVLFSLDMLKVD